MLDGDLSEKKVLVKNRLLAGAPNRLLYFKFDGDRPVEEDRGCVKVLIFEAVEAGGPSHNGGFCEGVKNFKRSDSAELWCVLFSAQNRQNVPEEPGWRPRGAENEVSSLSP